MSDDDPVRTRPLVRISLQLVELGDVEHGKGEPWPIVIGLELGDPPPRGLTTHEVFATIHAHLVMLERETRGMWAQDRIDDAAAAKR